MGQLFESRWLSDVHPNHVLSAQPELEADYFVAMGDVSHTISYVELHVMRALPSVTSPKLPKKDVPLSGNEFHAANNNKYCPK